MKTQFHSKKLIQFLFLCHLVLLCSTLVSAQETGIRFKDGNLELYSAELSNRYGIPQNLYNNIPQNELPLLLEIYRQYPNLVPQVIEQRNNNQLWGSIFSSLGIDPYFLYPTADVQQYGPPYSKAWEYYNNKSYKQYNWQDQELISLATVKMIGFVDNLSPEKSIIIRNKHPKVIIQKNHVKVKSNSKPQHAKNKSKGNGNAKKKPSKQNKGKGNKEKSKKK